MRRGTGSDRAQRLSRNIQEVVAEALQGRVSDPRLDGVTITEVRVTRDLRQARILWALYGDASDSRIESTQAGFRAATRMLRSIVSSALSLRHTPELDFQFDRGLAHARHMEELLGGMSTPELPEDEADAADEPQS